VLHGVGAPDWPEWDGLLDEVAGGLTGVLGDDGGGDVDAADEVGGDELAAELSATGWVDVPQPQLTASTPAAIMTLPNTDTFTRTPHVSGG